VAALVPGGLLGLGEPKPSYLTLMSMLLTRGIEHDQGVFLLLQDVPEVVTHQM
jgi:hypothetical protein